MLTLFFILFLLFLLSCRRVLHYQIQFVMRIITVVVGSSLLLYYSIYWILLCFQSQSPSASQSLRQSTSRRLLSCCQLLLPQLSAVRLSGRLRACVSEQRLFVIGSVVFFFFLVVYAMVQRFKSLTQKYSCALQL